MAPQRYIILGIASLFVAAPAAAQTQVPFVIEDGMVVPQEDCVVKIHVLGSEIVWQGGDYYDCPVGVRMTFFDGQRDEGDVEFDDEDSRTHDLFGPYNSATVGNVNDGGRMHRWYFPNRFDAEVTGIGIEAKTWERKAGRTGAYDSDWKFYADAKSWTGSDRVIVLRDGDPVPSVPGFEDQESVAYYVSPFVDTTTTPYTMNLGKNQVIYLMELGDRPVGHPYCDFQDVVVMVTLGDSFVELDAAGFATD
jgi:hypothetical protein